MIDGARSSFSLHTAAVSAHERRTNIADVLECPELPELRPMLSPAHARVPQVCQLQLAVTKCQWKYVSRSEAALVSHLHSLIETARHDEVRLRGMISAARGHVRCAASTPPYSLNGVDCIRVPVGQSDDRSTLARIPYFDSLRQRVKFCAN